MLEEYNIPVRKAKIFTSSPFSLYIKVLAFQGWFESINAYAASLIDVRSYVLVFAKPLF
jgi:hypothetical protein